MKKIFFIGGFLALMVQTGCDKNFLGTKPFDALSSENIWTSDKNASLAVNGIYNALGQYNALQQFSWVGTNLGPDGLNWAGGVINIAQGNGSTSDAEFLNTYTSFYKVISRANDAIFHLKDNHNVSEDMASQMIGEAEFLRGISYFYLWQLFGGVIILDKPTPPGETYLPRNTAEEVKKFIISDFTDAIERLPVSYTSDRDIGRATKGAAIAMLGKVYLYDKQWSNAAEEFHKLMNDPYQYKLLPDYSHLFNFNFKNNSEDIFSLQYTGVSGFGSFKDAAFSGRSAHVYGFSMTTASNLTVFSYTHQNGDPIDTSTMPKQKNYPDENSYGLDLIKWYHKTFSDVDKRLQANVILPGFTFVGNNDQLYEVKWPYSEHANDDTPAYHQPYTNIALFPWRKFSITGNDSQLRFDDPNNTPVIRYADVLLMYAEAKNEADGPSTEVYHAVNLVRERGGIPDLPAGLSQSELRNAIRLERFHEFAGEGVLYFDVKRWHTADSDDPVFGLNHEVKDFRGDILYKKTFTQKDYLWPIPQQEIDINNQLTQNPGW